MDDEIKTGEMTGEIDESITVEEDFTLLEGKAVSINDDSDNKTKEEEVYEEALDVKESLDDIRQQIKDKLLGILEKGKITDADGCEIELLNDQYNEKYNELKDLANTVIPGGKGTSIENASTTDNSTTEIVKINIDYDQILNAINEKADWLYIDEDGQVMLNGEVVPKLKVVELEAEKIKADVGEFKDLTTENFKATNAEITNLKADYGEFKNLTAGNFTAINADIDNLTANKADVDYLTSNYATINMLNTNVASINTALIDKANVSDLNATNALVEDLRASKADVADLTAVNAKITNLEAGKADVAVLEANYATIKQLDATNANVTSLQTETANINKALIDKANVVDLNATNAKVTDLQATKADVSDLNAAKANISTLTSDLAEVTTLVNGNLTSDNIQSMVITGEKFTVADAFIKNAMIDSVNANKINAGIINTNNVSIQSNDGSMVLQGNLQQFKDKNGKVRIQIGKDATGNFTFVLYDENGTGQLINEKGIQSSNAIADGLIVDAKVAENANIAGSKLDIDSVVTEVNNGSTSIKGTKIYLDDQSQSLDVAFNNMTTTVNGNTSTLNSHTTSINTMNGKITQLISDTTITKQDGTTTSLKDAYNATVDTVNSHTQTIGSLETNLSKVSTGQNKWLLEMYEKGEGIDDISPITINDIMGKALIKAVLVDDSVTSNQSTFGNEYLGRATTHVYLEADYNWETTATSDDGSTLYINGAAIATLTSCAPTTVTIPFKQGWNKITWVYNEGIGGDGWDFNPRLTTLPQVKYMNAYPMTNTDEVGNVLDSNIKTVSSKQATLEQNLDGFKQTVSNTYTTKADFDNLNVGGRNFIINSGFKGVVPDTATFPHWSHWGDVKVFHEQGNTNYNAINTLYLQNHTTTGGGIYQDISSNKIPKNSQITVSYDMGKEFNVITSYADLEFYDADHNRVGTIELGEDVGHVVKTVTTPDIDYSIMRFVLTHMGSHSDGGGYLVRIGNIKIEKGNKATDWTPAPEDIDISITAVDSKFVNYSTTNQMNSAINQKANEITSTVSETYATKASLTTVDNKFANYSTTSAMNSAINQKANEITSSVSETYATKKSVSDVSNNLTNNYSTTSAMNSAINQKANEITSTVSETYATKTALNTVDGKFANYSTTSDMNSAINQKSDSILSTVSNTYTTKADFNGLQVGGTNLLPKSGNFKGNTGSWGSNGGTLTLDSSVTYGGYSTVKIVGNNGATNNTWIQLKPNTTYTYSVLAKASSAITGNNTNPLHMWVNKTQASEHLEIIVSHNSSIGTKWTKAWITFKTPNNSDVYYMKPFIYGIQNATVWLANSKVEEGNKATDWSPAPADIDANITAVDGKFANYSTTSQMNSAINQKANEITSSVSETYATKTALNTVDGKFANYSTTSDMNSAINQKSDAILSTVSSTYATKTSLNEVDGKFADYSTTSAMNTAINQKADSILSTVNNTYATKESLNSVDGKFADYSTTSDMHSAINQKGDSILSSVSNTYATKAEFNNLEIGGTNLVLNSSFANGDNNWNVNGNPWPPTTAIDESTSPTGKALKVTINTTAGGHGIWQRITPRKTGNYTLSFYAKADTDNYNIVIGQEGSATKDIVLTTNWTKYTHTYNKDNLNSNAIIFYTRNNASNGAFYLHSVKLEYGNKATDWTPAPEDINASITAVDNKFVNYATINQMNSSIDQKANEINLNVSNNYATKTSVTDLNNNLSNNYSTTQQMNSAIDQKANEITSSVSQTYSTKSETSNQINDLQGQINNTNNNITNNYTSKSELQQTTNSITAKFSESGGYNLLRNSRALKGTSYWTDNGGGISVDGGNPPTIDHKYFCSNFPSGITYYDWIQLENNTHYIYSAKIYVVEPITFNGITPLHHWCTADKTAGQTQLSIVRCSHDGQTIPAGQWIDVWVEYLTASSGAVWFKPFIYHSGASCAISVTDLMLCKGSIPTLWSPHPSEVYDGITQIDKDGIKVYHNNIDGDNYTHMAPTGFYLKNKGEDVFKVDAAGLYLKGNVHITNGSVPSNLLNGQISDGLIGEWIRNGATNGSNAKSTLDNNAGNWNSTTERVNNSSAAWDNAYNRVVDWAYGSVGGRTTINGGLLQTNTVTTQHLAIGDFNNYSQLVPGHNLSNRYGYVNWSGGGDHFYWGCPGDSQYLPFTINETVNPFKQGDKVGFKFEAYAQTDLDVAIGVYFYSDDYASTYMAERTAALHINPGWNGYSAQVSIDCNEAKWARSVAIMIYKGADKYLEVRNVVIARMTGNVMIEDGAITASKISAGAVTADKISVTDLSALNASIGGFSMYSGKLVGTGGNGVGMSGNGDDWAFWAGSNTGGNAPFHVGHEGNLYATQAYISGTITASTINGSTINGTNINSDSFIGDMLAIDGTISAKSLQVQDIDNAKYPGAVTADFKLYVSTSGNDDSEIENGATFATFDGLLDKLPKNLNGHEVRIEMSTNITENVDFKGFHGGKIRLYMKGHTLYGYIVSRMGSARINICSGYIGNAADTSNGWGKIHPSKGYAVSSYTTTVASVDQGAIGLYNIDVYGADNYLSGSTTKLGVAGQDWGTAYLNGVSYYGCDIGARANAGGRIHDVLSYNVCTKYGFYATTGGYITLAGSEHSGGKSKNYHEADAGKVIVASGATFAGGEASVPGGSAPVTPTTKTITIKSTYGDTYRSSVYNSWKKDGTARQGDYGYGDCNGCWFFGDAFSDLEGKTINKVTIKITRQSGGSSAPVGLVVKSHGHSGRPSGAPTYRTTAGTLSLATGASGTLTITNSTILNEIKSGAVKGFGIQSTYNSSSYAVCSGSVTVKITYQE